MIKKILIVSSIILLAINPAFATRIRVDNSAKSIGYLDDKFVPYVGATKTVDLGAQTLTAEQLTSTDDALISDDLTVNDSAQLGDATTDIHGINITPASGTMLKASSVIATAGTGTDYFLQGAWAHAANESGATAKGFYLDLNSTGTSGTNLRGKSLRGTHIDIDDTQTIEGATPTLNIIGHEADVDFGGTITASNPDIQLFGADFNAGGNLGTTGSTLHVGAKASSSGTADKNVGLRAFTSGGTLNWAIEVTTGHIVLDEDGNASSGRYYVGEVQDGYWEHDGNSLNVVANAVTGTDDLELTANLVNIGGALQAGTTTLDDLTVDNTSLDNDILTLGVDGGKIVLGALGEASIDYTDPALTISAAGAQDKDIRFTVDSGGTPITISWDADTDTLEHSAGLFTIDDDILMNSTENIYFRDTAIAINSGADGDLDLTADVGIEMNTPAVGINQTATANQTLSLTMAATDTRGLSISGITNDYTGTGNGFDFCLTFERDINAGNGNEPTNFYGAFIDTNYKHTSADITNNDKGIRGISTNIDDTGSWTTSSATNKAVRSIGYYTRVNMDSSWESTGAGRIQHVAYGFEAAVDLDSTWDAGGGATNSIVTAGLRSDVDVTPTLNSGALSVINYGAFIDVDGNAAGSSTNYAIFISGSSGADVNYSIYDQSGANWLIDSDAAVIGFGLASPTTPDATMGFDSNSFNIIANAVTATDDMELTAQYVTLMNASILQINSAGDDKNIQINHDDTDSNITVSAGELNFSATVFDFDSNSNSQNIYIRGADAGNEWANLFVNAADDFNVFVNGGLTILDSNSNTECLRLVATDAANDYADMFVDADGDFYLQSTGVGAGTPDIVIKLNDAAGASVFHIFDNADVTQFNINSDGDVNMNGDFLFTASGGGLAFGEIYVKDNAAAITLNSAAKVQVTIFDTDGVSNNSTPDHTNDHITITKAGMYLCTVSCALVNVAAQAHIVELSLYKNNGATAFNNIHSHRNLAGGGGDKGSISMSGIIDLAVNDTIELWADTDAAADRDVTFEDVTLSLVQVGGT